MKENDEQIIFDYKNKFRRQQIESEGNDPAKSGQSQGTPSDLAMGRTGHELDDEGGSEEGGQQWLEDQKKLTNMVRIVELEVEIR